MDDKVELLVGAGGSIPSKWSQWNAESTYTPLRSVTHLGSSYVCKKACKGVDPEADVALGDGVEGEYWIKTASKGDKGDKGDRGIKGDSTEVTATEIEEGIQLDIKNTVYKEDGSAEEAQKSTLVKHGNLQFPAGASVGDIVKIIQVKNGKPTKWMSIPFFQEFKNEVALLENSPFITSAEMKDRKTVRFKNAYANKVFDLDATPLAFICNSFAEKGQVPVVDAVDENGDPTEWSTTNLPKGIDVTGGAAVGQIIQVSKVDSNGKPTEWKAIDLPSGTGGVSVPNGAKVGQIIQVSKVDGSGKPTEWKAVDMPKGEVTADSLSLTINPADGKIYITVNGVMVGQGVQGGAPVSYGDVEVDNMILKLNNGQSVTFNVRLSEPPTNPQVVTILSDSEHITFDKSKLTFTADNYDTYQTVTASAENVTKDGTASIIIRNSDELMTDSFITVYLKAEFYNVDTTIPTEGQHIVTMDDFESSSAYGNYIRLYNYIGEYDNIVIPAQLDGKIPWICCGTGAPSATNTTFLTTGTALKYVTFEDGVIYRGSGVTKGCVANGLFGGFTSLIGVSNMNPETTSLANAFSGCTSLKFVDNLHELTNVTSLNNTFFESCIEYLPDLSGMVAVTTMETWVKNCTSLKRVYGMPIPATSCNTNQLFSGCSALEKAEVPQNATTMFYCFNGCTSLREVTVHATGITAATSAFKDCTNLTVYLDADTTTYDTLIGLYGSSTDITFVTDGGASDPSIVVWGDSTSSPNRAWKEWPARLQEAVSGYLIKNQAASGEFTTSTSARQGGNALSVGAFTIPADTSAVGITLKSSDGHTFGADPVFSAAHSFNPCTISGVQGTISRSGSSYTFTRTNAGEVVEVAEGAIVTSDADDLFNNADAVMLVNIGINSGWDEDADVLLNQVQLMVNHFTAKGGTKYIITGPYAGKFLTTDEYRQTVFSYEEKAATAFGEHWLNLREYLIENGLTENGLTATATDTERMALGQIPGSLLGGGSTTDIQMYPDTSSDQTHPNAYGQNSIFNAFYNKGVALGYWT